MPTPTYTPLANLTLSTTASTVTFSSINQGFRDIVLVMDMASSVSDSYPSVRVNGDSGSNYPRVSMYGTGSAASSDSTTLTNIDVILAISTTQRGNAVLSFMDYSATDKHKTVLVRSGNSANYVSAIASRWTNTSAITSIAISSNSAGFAAGSTFALYGIAS